MALLDYFSGYH
jgi:hypothetical protein